MHRIGTSHFVSFRAACIYYRDYGCNQIDVSDKLRVGEIHLGPPAVKADEKVVTIDNGRRYAIEVQS